MRHVQEAARQESRHIDILAFLRSQDAAGVRLQNGIDLSGVMLTIWTSSG